jgi:hypothetical protein
MKRQKDRIHAEKETEARPSSRFFVDQSRLPPCLTRSEEEDSEREHHRRQSTSENPQRDLVAYSPSSRPFAIAGEPWLNPNETKLQEIGTFIIFVCCQCFSAFCFY